MVENTVIEISQKNVIAEIEKKEVIAEITRKEVVFEITGGIGGTTDHTKLTNKGFYLHTQIDSHIDDKNNPHELDKDQLGLGNVDNTSDADKPISDDTQTALDLKEDLANKDSNVNLGTSNIKYPTQKAVKEYIDAKVGSAVILQGDWDADTNTPDITGTTTTGYAWRVSVAGNTNCCT